MFDIVESLVNLWKTTGIYQMLFTDGQLDMAFIKTLIMLASRKPSGYRTFP